MILESQIQKAVIGWASHKKNIRDHLIHIPNGGFRNPREGASLRRQGVKKGVSDLFLALPSNGFHGFWIELKSKRGRVSAEQTDWLDRMKAAGYKTAITRSIEDTIQAIEDYMS